MYSAPAKEPDLKELKRRLTFAAATVIPITLLLSGYHASLLLERGKSIWPVAILPLLLLAVLASVYFWTTRRGPEQVQQRANMLVRRVVPVVVGLNVLRVLIEWLAK